MDNKIQSTRSLEAKKPSNSSSLLAREEHKYFLNCLTILNVNMVYENHRLLRKYTIKWVTLQMLYENIKLGLVCSEDVFNVIHVAERASWRGDRTAVIKKVNIMPTLVVLLFYRSHIVENELKSNRKQNKIISWIIMWWIIVSAAAPEGNTDGFNPTLWQRTMWVCECQGKCRPGIRKLQLQVWDKVHTPQGRVPG